MTKIVPVELAAKSRHYDIIVGSDLLDHAGEHIVKCAGQKRCVIIVDENVASIYLQRLELALTNAGHKVLPSILVPAGEASKDFTMLHTVLNQLFERGIDRHTLIIAFGGGVIGDLAGFAASQILRGIDFVQMPTTLLAQVDSSVGGKTGINSNYGKNTIGAFYQPILVLADVDVLNTLPTRELRAGYAEAVKYGLIGDADFFIWCIEHGNALLNGDKDARLHAVQKSCAAKSRIVAADEREAGERALLNFGHTFGHALEAFTGYGKILLHGEAVAIGMMMAFELSAQLGLCSVSAVEKVRHHFTATGLPTTPPPFAYAIDALMALMAQDKKAQDNALTLILTRGIGKAFVAKNVDPAPIRNLWIERTR